MNTKTNKIMYNNDKITEISNEINELLDKVKKLRQEKLNLEQENINKHLNIGDYVKILSDDGLDDRYMLVNEIMQTENNLKIIGPSFSFYLNDDCINISEEYINVNSWSYEYINPKDIEKGTIQVISKEEFETVYNEMFKKVYDSLFNK